MYAFTVKNSAGTWDLRHPLSDIPIPERKDRLETALTRSLPITGRNVTEHKTSIKSGAIWNGTEWIGGDSTPISEELAVNLFAYIWKDTIILIQFSSPNTESDEQITAIFESENSMIKVPEGQTVNVGDIWDGENIINK